ncbi:crotonobetaine/carnitine-CoA ligase [Albimonas donghaensis]|uniref:Crotonobetaine/carnitine-CoA ligase n=1 Tax=Albimonas donghaensis TaxID=356660 RepID=A0A1H3DN08_9RHOB|nr:AMP-binding protein [Albimonas donghaensis]SDX67902.1 crotonobetaine/carnitine-CoA ligase [Albimonas donghaensis]
MVERRDAALSAPCVLREALERRAGAEPDAVCAVFEDGAVWTCAGALRKIRRAAAGLQRLGVRQDDRVLVMMPNGETGLLAMFAANYIGAVSAPVNTAYRGGLLAHVVGDAGAVVAVVHPALLDRLTTETRGGLEKIIVAGEAPAGVTVPGAALFDLSVFDADEDPAPPPRPIAAWDVQSIIYTSGTTGPSKGVLATYMQAYTATCPETWSFSRPDDRHLLHMPIFHIGGAFLAHMALCSGGSIAVVESFRTDDFWDVIRRLEVTNAFLLGAMATFLLKRPPAPDDREHRLRVAAIVPLGQSGPAFHERFGCDVHTLFNMTEICSPLISGPNPAKPGICGRPRPGVEIRLVDSHDIEVPDGTPGEMMLRADQVWAITPGYHNRPEATVAAWRNGWFHTGDVFVKDADGDFRFVDRIKDAIRRRGENISSYEVEVEILAHPDVREAAVVAVPSEHGEDEVLAVIAPVAGRALEPEALIAFLRPRLAHFMIPRFVRVLDALPKTPTEKVEKHRLRAEGLTPDCWDREAAGIVIRRDRLAPPRSPQ